MYSSESCFFSKISFCFFYCQLRNLLTGFFFSVSRDVPAFSGRFVSVYIRRRDFYDLERQSREWHITKEKKCIDLW